MVVTVWSADARDRAPLALPAATVDEPVVIDTVPPVADDDAPACTVIAPPAPVSPFPTVKAILPPAPPLAAPVDKATDPLAPAVAAPVTSSTAPVAKTESFVESTMDPEALPVVVFPVAISTEPPMPA